MRRLPVHPAWFVAGVTLFSLLAAAAFRSSMGVLLEPWEQDFGWSRATTSEAASLNLVLFGLTAPLAAAVMEQWGLRRTVTASLAVAGSAATASLWMTQAWQLWLLWGVVIGIGTGALALTFGAIVANRWFETHRGFVTGLFSAASAAGQVVFVPLVAQSVSRQGWQSAVAIIAAACLLAALLCLVLLRDRPEQLGVRPLGAAHPHPERPVVAGLEADVEPSVGTAGSPLRATLAVLVANWRTRALVGLLVTFMICGWSTNGIIQTHFVPAAHDHHMPMHLAANVLGLIGIFDVVGTVASGWLTDRYDPRLLLATYYGLRGLSLVPINYLLDAHITPSMWLFIIFYGLDWTATVPPTVALCREHFGLKDSGIAFGWVYASHMVGAGLGASVSGSLRAADGSYTRAWVLTCLLCLAAAAVSLWIPRHRAGSQTVVAQGDRP
ncbi:MFS transporter [Luteococcus peritonei]|uniref:MFS transporter n=1 Tax=Luteococcus peritonei TaxID=88874 RepID=A0ABW4RWP7_9ACTN